MVLHWTNAHIISDHRNVVFLDRRQELCDSSSNPFFSSTDWDLFHFSPLILFFSCLGVGDGLCLVPLFPFSFFLFFLLFTLSTFLSLLTLRCLLQSTWVFPFYFLLSAVPQSFRQNWNWTKNKQTKQQVLSHFAVNFHLEGALVFHNSTLF